MPYPSQPPFEAGALLQPRQLQRWLDVNKVSKLTRTQTYWVLPAFSVESNWLGYSQLVAAFNFTATNNFSLPAFDAPVNPNYCACIMWVDEDYNVYRYKMWESVGEVFYFYAPLYNGEMIKKNFRIEIWDTAPDEVPRDFTMAGAGSAGIDGTWSYAAAGEYENGLNTMLEDPVSWAIFNQFSSLLYTTTDLNNFPFGLWTVDGVGVAPAPFAYISQTTSSTGEITFYTSVAGQYDYMWANDAAMATASAVVTDFSVPLPADIPIEWPADSVPVLN